MSSIKPFIEKIISSSRKRTGIVYCSGSFEELLDEAKLICAEIVVLDCCDLDSDSFIFSAPGLIEAIEDNIKGQTAIVMNLEAFISPNSLDFPDQLAKLLAAREPLHPIIFAFYSKKVFTHFRDLYRVRAMNSENVLEI